MSESDQPTVISSLEVLSADGVVTRIAGDEEKALVKSRDERIDELELAIIQHPNIIDLPVTHRFTPGMYSRELRSPAGVLATTYIHKHEHQFVLISGEVSVLEGLSETGKRIRAPFHGITPAGTRRVVYVHEDAIWTTFHPTECTDVESVEAEIFDFRILPDGTNVRDRFREAIRQKALADGELSQTRELSE